MTAVVSAAIAVMLAVLTITLLRHAQTGAEPEDEPFQEPDATSPRPKDLNVAPGPAATENSASRVRSTSPGVPGSVSDGGPRPFV